MYLDNGKEIIRKYVDSGLLPGAVFAFVTKDSIEKDCYGYKALYPEKEKVSLDSLYDLASLSKVVATDTMMFRLLDEKTVSLNERVCDILDDFPYEDITIRDLMTHTSGFPADDKNYKQCADGRELWHFMMNDLKMSYERGTKVEYSCFGYIVLGKIIEHFKGNLDEYLHSVLDTLLQTDDILYQPAKYGRKNECVPTEVTEARGIIKGEVHDGKAHINNGLSGNAGIFASIEPLCRFTQMILDDGKYNGNTVYSPETMKMLKESATEGLNERRTIGGWFAGDRNQSDGKCISEVSLYHTGFTGTSIYIDFERECAIILLTNAVHPGRVHKMSEIRPAFHNQVLTDFDNIRRII